MVRLARAKLNIGAVRFRGVSSGEMTQRRIYDTEHHVTEEGAENGTRLVPENTILVVVRGMSLAKEFRISMTGKPVTFNQDLKALHPSHEDRFGFSILLSSIAKPRHTRFRHLMLLMGRRN